jgi:hypothetical protein
MYLSVFPFEVLTVPLQCPPDRALAALVRRLAPSLGLVWLPGGLAGHVTGDRVEVISVPPYSHWRRMGVSFTGHVSPDHKSLQGILTVRTRYKLLLMILVGGLLVPGLLATTGLVPNLSGMRDALLGAFLSASTVLIVGTHLAWARAEDCRFLVSALLRASADATGV